MKNKNNTIRLKAWLLNKPIFFAVSFFLLSATLCFGYAIIQTVFNIESIVPMFILFALSFVICTWYTIKKLPHTDMFQNDFIAITNGASLISISTSLLTVFIMTLGGQNIKQNVGMFHILHPTLFIVLFLILTLFSLYLVGVAICNVYAKYKRAKTIGIAPWKIILSMPFAFLLMWAPGYLIKDKNTKTNLDIKSQWYKRFNQWVITNPSNVVFVFLLFLLCKGVIAGLATFVLYAILLIFYTLWYVKHKSDFIKNANNGYALTAVGINLAIILTILTQIHY